MKKTIALTFAIVPLVTAGVLLAGCGSKEKKTEVTVFAAKSLNGVMDELCEKYNREHPNVTFQTNYDSSGTLMTQIKEGAKCNIFFSAGVSQMDELQAGFDGGDIVEGSRKDLLNNQVCLVTWKGGDTKVDQLTDDVISEALGGLLINNCANVGAVASAVAEGANEIGTVYYSDTFGYEDQLEIIEKLPNSLTGDVIYPVAAVEGDNTSDAELEASQDFLDYLQSEEAVKLFEKYHFTVQ